MKSVKTKVIVLVMSCMLLSSLTIGTASIYHSKKVVIADSEQIMNLRCANSAAKIDALLNQIEHTVKMLTDYAVRQIGDVEKFQTDSAYVGRYTEKMTAIAINAAQNTDGAMSVYVRYNPDFTDSRSGLFCSKNLAGGDFQVLPPTDLTAYDSTDTTHVGWFYEPAKNKTGTWLAPYLNENINVEMISYVIPYYVDDVFIGVVGMDIDFSVLKNIVTQTTVYDGSYAFLTDEHANVIYHEDLPRGTALLDFNGGEFHGMADQLTQESSGDTLLGYTYKGELREAAFRSLSNGMRFVLASPTGQINASANLLILQIFVTTILAISAAGLFTLVFTRRLVKPLLELTVAAKKIADGDLSVSITHQSNDEVGMLADSFRQTVKHLHKYISYINELAYRDPLTGVKNKTAYLEAVKQMDDLTRLKRPEFAVVVFDINELKTVNDTLGHDFGDMLIADTCKLVCRTFKRSPVYRIGGDEFVAILENEDYRNYSDLLEQLQIEIDKHNKQHHEFHVSVARGIAVFSEETDLTYHDVFKRADSGMYRNKAEMKAKR